MAPAFSGMNRLLKRPDLRVLCKWRKRLCFYVYVAWAAYIHALRYPYITRIGIQRGGELMDRYPDNQSKKG